MYKTAAHQAYLNFLQKQALAVTDEGHKYDAAVYRAMQRAAEERARAQAEFGALGFRDETGKKHFGNIFKVLRAGLSSPGIRSVDAARHYNYAAKKHEKGENAWNPLGGLLTPTEAEQGGNRFFRGKPKGLKIPKD